VPRETAFRHHPGEPGVVIAIPLEESVLKLSRGPEEAGGIKEEQQRHGEFPEGFPHRGPSSAFYMSALTSPG